MYSSVHCKIKTGGVIRYVINSVHGNVLYDKCRSDFVWEEYCVVLPALLDVCTSEEVRNNCTCCNFLMKYYKQ